MDIFQTNCDAIVASIGINYEFGEILKLIDGNIGNLTYRIKNKTPSLY